MTSDDDGTARFTCGDLAAEDSDQPLAELFLANPATDPEPSDKAQYSFNTNGDISTTYSLNPGKPMELPLEVGAPRLMPRTEFTLQFVAAVNGVNQVYDLRDGDRPFLMGSLPDGGGYHVTEYLWCPGSPGRLTRSPAGPSQGPVPRCR
jgi:hypothetical protein